MFQKALGVYSFTLRDLPIVNSRISEQEEQIEPHQTSCFYPIHSFPQRHCSSAKRDEFLVVV